MRRDTAADLVPVLTAHVHPGPLQISSEALDNPRSIRAYRAHADAAPVAPLTVIGRPTEARC